MPERRPLPGAIEQLRHLRKEKIRHGIATSGRRQDAQASLDALDLPDDRVVVDRDGVETPRNFRHEWRLQRSQELHASYS